MNDLFVEGDTGRSRFAITGYFFQGLRATDNSESFPLACRWSNTPTIRIQQLLGGQFRFDFNSVSLYARHRHQQPAR